MLFPNAVYEVRRVGNNNHRLARLFQEIDHVVLQEQIAYGERVRDHIVEGLVGEKWVTLAQGKVIGHKWIYKFKSQKVSKLRLKVSKSLAKPKIRSFTCYMIGEK